MNQKKIFNFIKTPCGRIKYEALCQNKTLYGRIRLYFFIIIASIRDFKIKS